MKKSLLSFFMGVSLVFSLCQSGSVLASSDSESERFQAYLELKKQQEEENQEKAKYRNTQEFRDFQDYERKKYTEKLLTSLKGGVTGAVTLALGGAAYGSTYRDGAVLAAAPVFFIAGGLVGGIGGAVLTFAALSE